MSNNYFDFLKDLGVRESSGDYSVVNTYGYLGAFQMGKMALIDAGLYSAASHENIYDNVNYSDSGWTNYANGLGVSSVRDFLNNPDSQNVAIQNYHNKAWQSIQHFGLDEFVGQTINGVEITKSGLLAGYHLKGIGNEDSPGLKHWLHGEGDNQDGYGTTISSYVEKFSGYDIGFENNSTQDDDQIGIIEPPTTPGDLLAGGSPDDAFANPEPPESSFTDAVGDTLEDIGDAIEEAWEDRGAQAVGAAASASFMTYANLNGWTEEDWLDESHEQSIASFVVNEVAQDIVTFDFSAGDFNLFEWNAVNANGDAVAGTGANMIALLAAGEIASELGLGGTDLASTVGTSMAISGMQYTISTTSTGETTVQTQPSAPPRLCFSVREPLKVNNNWGQVVETPRLGEVRSVAVRQGQATAPLGAAA